MLDGRLRYPNEDDVTEQKESLATVSVVIPTRNRAVLVRRAVDSVLAQTYTDFELIVVIDGPDEATEAILATVDDARLRVKVHPASLGGAQARNSGVEEARTEWIAFLDDDDLWLPGKLAAQMKVALSAGEENICVACKFIEQSEMGERTLPLRVPDAGEPISEYFFCPKSMSLGEGFVQTSTLVMRRASMQRTPFLPGLACGQEMTWMLRSARDENLKLVILPEPMVLFNDFQSRSRISIAPKWRTLYNWAREHREYFTPKAYSFFTATICIQYANSCNEPFATYVGLFREFLKGAPTPKSLFLFFARWLAPSGLRRKGAALLKKISLTLKGEHA
jgi:glycosyltransferase involved in cell wall biosynthesis